MKWPTVEQMAAKAPLPDGYRHEWLKRAEMLELVNCIERWHPDIAVGGGSCSLREDFCTDKVYLDGEEEKAILVGLFKRGYELAGMWSWEREPDALTLYARLIIIAPARRGAKLATFAMKVTGNLGRAMCAAFRCALATLKVRHAQRALADAGYRLLGFFPGYDREELAPAIAKRVYQAVYAKLLVSEDESLHPDARNPTPRSRALYGLLFSDEPARPAGAA